MRTASLWLLLGSFSLAVLAGCGASGEAEEPREEQPRRERLRDRTPRQLPERVPEQAEQEPVTGEVPEELLDEILEAASDASGVPEEDIEIEKAESVVWNDGSLGCPEPGKMYTQALVEGYHVVLRAGSETFDYRADADGHFIRCPSPSLR